jgi:drug/metabolite transporter (DMT)-like permease
VDAVTLLALRMGLSLPFFLALGWADRRRRQPVPLTGRDWGLMLGLGVTGYYLASYLDFLGLQYISAALERLILFAYPTLVVLFSALFLGKPITRRAAGSIALCYAGIALAVAHDLDLGGDAHEVWLGGALVFGSAVSYALYLMGNGQAVGRLGAARVTAAASTIACVLCLVHFAATRPLGLLVQPAPVMGLAVAMALFSTVLPVWMVSEAIRRLGAGPVSLIGTLGPVVTLFLGWLILAEPIGVYQLVGGALVIAGVLLVGSKR